MPPAPVHGSCPCGAVQVDVSRFAGRVTYCHCTQCRLDAPTGLHSRAHTFVADKGDYHELQDGLPQHDRPD